MDSVGMLREIFGYDSFREGQADVVDRLQAGQSVLAIFPTGAGKSICYQLPALMMPGLTLVVSPLMALMKDQVDFLKGKNIEADKLDSSLTPEEYKEIIGKIRNKTLKILFVSPERFNNEIFRNIMLETAISMFVIDEAHCISEWGHNFRPDYLKLANYATDFKAQRVLCLTATANLNVAKDIETKFDIQAENSFRLSAYRDNLKLNIVSLVFKDKNKKLLELLSKKRDQSSIVYVTLQKTAEQVTTYLIENGIEAQFYHAGLEHDKREAIQDYFMHSPHSVIVATIAFGMGIDKSDIRNVFHYNLPKSIENYYQEIGRAGRDGMDADCTLFLCADDVPILEAFAIGDFPESDLVSDLLNDLFKLEDEFSLKLTSFASAHDMKQIVVKTILTHLELMGYVQELTPIYSVAKFKLVTDEDTLIAKFPESKQPFLKQLLSFGVKKKIWAHLNIKQVCEGMQLDRRMIMNTLSFLDQKSLIELALSGLENRFQFVDKAQTLLIKDKIIADITQLTAGHLQNQLDRIGELVGFFTDDNCIQAAIAKYFETPLSADCGHCSYCLTQIAAELILKADAGDNQDSLSFDVVEFKRSLSSHQHIVTSDSRMAKFLLGIRTPYVSKNKLAQSEYFGLCAGNAWDQVIERLK